MALHLFRLFAATLGAALLAGFVAAAALAAGADMPLQLAVQALVRTLADFLPWAVPVVDRLLGPFPLAGLLACAVLGTVSARAAPTYPHAQPSEKRHGGRDG